MKLVKILTVIALVTVVFGTIGTKAVNQYALNLDVPPRNGRDRTPWKGKQTAEPQRITNAVTNPSYDSLDAKLMLWSDKDDSGLTASEWRVIGGGTSSTTFTRVDSLLFGNDYYLYVDSRPGYTKYTKLTGIWVIN